MARTITRCSFCPAVQKKTHKNILMHPLFVEGVVDCLPADPVSRRQAIAFREAIAPYICLAELRRLATNGENILAALLMLEMGGLDHEEFWVACLDTKKPCAAPALFVQR